MWNVSNGDRVLAHEKPGNKSLYCEHYIKYIFAFPTLCSTTISIVPTMLQYKLCTTRGVICE
jgi:hypothetical protein